MRVLLPLMGRGFFFVVFFLDGFSKCLQQSSTELEPGFDRQKEDSQADATAAGEPFTPPHAQTHARQTHTHTDAVIDGAKVKL